MLRIVTIRSAQTGAGRTNFLNSKGSRAAAAVSTVATRRATRSGPDWQLPLQSFPGAVSVRLLSVLREKLVLDASVVPGQRNCGCWQGDLVQRGGSMFALLLRDGAYAQKCKGYCYSRCHFGFDR